jgi:hypothetical protein
MINVITMEIDDDPNVTVQVLLDGTVLIWADGDTDKPADVSITLNDLRRVIRAAEIMRREP